MNSILFTAMHKTHTAIFANKLVKLDVFKLIDVNSVRHNELWVS